MDRGFWDTLPRPFFALAPMVNLTNAVTRRMIAECGRADVSFTEFVSTAGLCSRGRARLLPDLFFCEAERPVVAQFFGRVPEQFVKAAALAAELGFDGIDINMGCPDKAVLRQGAGSGLMKEPELAAEIVQAAREGGRGLPVSVKTRIGYQEEEVDSWVARVVAMRPAALSLHGRTRKQKYLGQADWEAIARAAVIAHEAGVLLVGNGDIKSRDEGLRRAAESGCDGVMIGRAIIGNPWLFNPAVNRQSLDREVILDTMLRHAHIHEQVFSGIRPFLEMRTHLSRYVNDFPGARQLRDRLHHASSAADVEAIIREYREYQAAGGTSNPTDAPS